MILRALPALLAALVLASCGGGDEHERAAGASGGSLTDVADVSDLRAAFEADSGRPRLLLLLSPT